MSRTIKASNFSSSSPSWSPFSIMDSASASSRSCSSAVSMIAGRASASSAAYRCSSIYIWRIAHGISADETVSGDVKTEWPISALRNSDTGCSHDIELGCILEFVDSQGTFCNVSAVYRASDVQSKGQATGSGGNLLGSTGGRATLAHDLDAL